MMLFKTTNDNGSPCHGGTGKWNLPVGNKPGKWMPEVKPVLPDEIGYHLCKRSQLVQWLGPAIWIAEGAAECRKKSYEIVFSKARLLCRVGNWDDRTARLFICDCVEHALNQIPNPNPRCKKTIEVARAFANGKATKAELAKVDDRAWDMAWDMAWSTKKVVQMNAIKSSAFATMKYAVWSASDAVCHAAYAVAYAASSGMDGTVLNTALTTERQWQTKRLFHYLEMEDK